MREIRIEAVGGDLSIPKIILGSSAFGTGIDRKTAFAIMDRYAELGGTCIDTGVGYGDCGDGINRSELCIGEWLSSSPYGGKVKIISKCCHPKHVDGVPYSRVGRGNICSDLEKSLKAIGRGAIDVYLLHFDNPEIPVGEIMDTLHEYVQAGQIKAIGASNWDTQRIEQANVYAEQHGKTPFTVSQLEWSLAYTDRDYVGNGIRIGRLSAEERAWYLKNHLPVLAWSSQAGFVIQKLMEGKKDAIGEFFADRYVNQITEKRALNAKSLCEKYGITPTQAVLAYIICNALPAAAIIGPRLPEMLDDSMSAADLTLPPEAVEALTRGSL